METNNQNPPQAPETNEMPTDDTPAEAGAIATTSEPEAGVQVIVVIALLILVLAGIFIYIRYGMNHTPADQASEPETTPVATPPTKNAELTEMEKINILSTLASGSDEETLTREQKRAILGSLSGN